MTAGAKLRMLVTPAATSASATSWATAAGVVMTPIDTERAPTVSASGSIPWISCSPCSRDGLGRGGRRGDDTDRDGVGADRLGESVHPLDLVLAVPLPESRRVGV